MIDPVEVFGGVVGDNVVGLMHCPFEAQREDQPVSGPRTVVGLCVLFIECALLILLHRWDFILIDTYQDLFVKMTGFRGPGGDQPERTLWGIEVEVFHWCVFLKFFQFQ